MSRKRANISAALRARRALLLAEGRRRFYVHPLDVGPHSMLAGKSHDSVSDCIAAAHAWLQRVRSEDFWWFSIVERAELPGQSVVASVRDFLVYNDLLPLLPSVRREGRTFDEPREARAKSGSNGVSRTSGTFKASDGKGSPCRRYEVPRHG